MREDEEAADEATARAPSPFGPGDKCHFAYQAQRREYTEAEARDEGMTLDDAIKSRPWLACLNEFEDLKEANASLIGQIALRPPGAEAIITNQDDSTVLRKFDDDHLLTIELLSAFGKV